MTRRRPHRKIPLHKNVILLVSYSYSNLSGIPRKRGIVFFHNLKEYEDLSRDNNWEAEKTCKSTWCVRPVEIEASVEEKAYDLFIKGGSLSAKSVMFTLKNLSLVNKIE